LRSCHHISDLEDSLPHARTGPPHRQGGLASAAGTLPTQILLDGKTTFADVDIGRGLEGFHRAQAFRQILPAGAKKKRVGGISVGDDGGFSMRELLARVGCLKQIADVLLKTKVGRGAGPLARRRRLLAGFDRLTAKGEGELNWGFGIRQAEVFKIRRGHRFCSEDGLFSNRSLFGTELLGGVRDLGVAAGRQTPEFGSVWCP